MCPERTLTAWLTSQSSANPSDETVSGEPVCEANSLLSGKKTGNFAKSLA